MKTLAVVGSRSLAGDEVKYTCAKSVICQAMLDGEFNLYVSGGAKGPDTWGEEVADYLGIEKRIYKPDWAKYGRSAGFKRNGDIVHDADYVLVFWDGVSRGTQHDITLCQGMGTDYDVYMWDAAKEYWYRKGGEAYPPLTDVTVNA